MSGRALWRPALATLLCVLLIVGSLMQLLLWRRKVLRRIGVFAGVMPFASFVSVLALFALFVPLVGAAALARRCRREAWARDLTVSHFRDIIEGGETAGY
eukprot:Rhum_TRINITY_DN1066_c0_g1::Rhum_TRINITY_DN1066_c0_g1_i1::g.3213::m.3213